MVTGPWSSNLFSMKDRYGKILLLILSFIAFNSNYSFGHAVQVAWGFDPSGTNLRIYIEHWHGNLISFPGTATIDVSVSVAGGAPITAVGVLPTGGFINTSIGSLPILAGTTMNIIVNTSGGNAYNDWGYWDTPLSSLGIACDNANPPIALTVTVNNPADVIFTASGFSYPQTAVTAVNAPDCPPCETIPTNDCDGDGVINSQESADGTDPLDSCSFVLASATMAPSVDWTNADCDGDGVSNGQEVIDGTALLDPCSFNLSSVNVTPSTAWDAADCDGDGV